MVKHAVGIRVGSHLARAARVEGGGRHTEGVARPVSVRSGNFVITYGQHLKPPKQTNFLWGSFNLNAYLSQLDILPHK